MNREVLTRRIRSVGSIVIMLIVLTGAFFFQSFGAGFVEQEQGPVVFAQEVLALRVVVDFGGGQELRMAAPHGQIQEITGPAPAILNLRRTPRGQGRIGMFGD